LKTADYKAAAAFLWEAPTAKANLCAIHPTRRGAIRGYTFDKTAANKVAAERWMEKVGAAGFGIYFYVNDLSVILGKSKDVKGNIIVKAGDLEVSRVNALHVDLDPPKGTAQADMPAIKANLLSSAAAYVSVPTIIINSGNGLGLFWTLFAPVDVTDENREHLRALNKQLTTDLHGDSCFDLCRVMRVPFTINIPNASKIKAGRVPALATIIENTAGLTDHNIDDFSPAPLDQQNDSEVEDFGTPTSATIESLELDSVLGEVIRTGKHTNVKLNEDRSNGAFHIMCRLIRLDVSNEDILALALQPDYAGFAHLHDRQPRGPLKTAERMLRRALKDEPRAPCAEDDFEGDAIELTAEDQKASDQARDENKKAAADDKAVPRVKVKAEHVDKMVRQVQDILIRLAKNPEQPATDQVYIRDSNLVHLNRNRLKPGTTMDALYHVPQQLIIQSVTTGWLHDLIRRSMIFFMETARGSMDVDPPAKVVNSLQEINTSWKFPRLLATTETPTLRANGTILDKPGFDLKSGIYYDPRHAKFPPVEKMPTKAQAMAALEILKRALVNFPFADEDGIEGLSLSVALSMMLTCVCRRALDIAPMFGIDANEAQSGKTELAQVIAIMMTGRPTGARPFPKDEYQRENAFAAALEAGDGMILFDNVDGETATIEGKALEMMLTSEIFQCRRLGGNGAEDQVRVPSNAMIVGTGNHLTAAGAMTEDRMLISKLVPEPGPFDKRKFEHWPLKKWVAQERPLLVSAALTVLRAYAVSTGDKTPVYFRFAQWHDTVADALVWLGLPDPARSTARVKESDPIKEGQREVMREWTSHVGETWRTIAYVLETYKTVKPAIADACGLVSENNLSKDRASKYLKGMVGVDLDGYRLEKMIDQKRHILHWRAKCIRENARVQIEEEPALAPGDSETNDFLEPIEGGEWP
jgi:hypothetical protein